MGLFDRVYAPCPKCGALNDFQSKGAGYPSLENYTLANAPSEVLMGCGTEKCGCGASYRLAYDVHDTGRERIVDNVRVVEVIDGMESK